MAFNETKCCVELTKVSQRLPLISVRNKRRKRLTSQLTAISTRVCRCSKDREKKCVKVNGVYMSIIHSMRVLVDLFSVCKIVEAFLTAGHFMEMKE